MATDRRYSLPSTPKNINVDVIDGLWQLTLRHNYHTADGDDIKVANADAWKKIASVPATSAVHGNVTSPIGPGIVSTNKEGRGVTPDLWTSAASEIEADRRREIDRKIDVSIATSAMYSSLLIFLMIASLPLALSSFSLP